MMKDKKNKEKQISEEQRELENTGDTGIDFLAIFKEIFK
jgi:hypothetical protein